MTVRHTVAALLVAFGAWLWVANVALAALASLRGRTYALVPWLTGVSGALGVALWPGLSWWWVALPIALDPGTYGLLRRQP